MPRQRWLFWFGRLGGLTFGKDRPMTRLLALFALLAVTACETIEGAGQDIETAGEAITEESQEAQAGM